MLAANLVSNLVWVRPQKIRSASNHDRSQVWSLVQTWMTRWLFRYWYFILKRTLFKISWNILTWVQEIVMIVILLFSVWHGHVSDIVFWWLQNCCYFLHVLFFVFCIRIIMYLKMLLCMCVRFYSKYVFVNNYVIFFISKREWTKWWVSFLNVVESCLFLHSSGEYSCTHKDTYINVFLSM